MHRRFHRSSKAASNYHRYSRCLTPVNIQSTENTILKSNFGLWNARSLRNKTASICDFIVSEKISILALTEIWLFGDERDNSTIATITNCLPYFNITHRARAGRGGGVCVMHHKGLISKPLILQSFTSFEYLDLVISSGSVSVRLINVYRPPTKKGHNISVRTFLDEFANLLEDFIIHPGRIFIVRDFNLHVDKYDNHDATLPFLSKTLERVVAAELNTYLTDSNLFSSRQPAYRRHHSVETALLRVANDFLVALDNGNEVLLVLLDYTAAFDTVNHSILLHRLEHRFGISGTVLCWLKSCLNNRSQYVKVDGFDSSSISLNYGVPQGSVLGPLLFTLYEDIIKHHGLDAMFYADDTQIYIALNAKERSTDLQRLEKCAADIKS